MQKGYQSSQFNDKNAIRKNFFPDFICTHVHMGVYGRYALGHLYSQPFIFCWQICFLVHFNFWCVGDFFPSDIADVSVEQCKERYKELQKTHESRRYRDPLFEPEFITADCSKVTSIQLFQIAPIIYFPFNLKLTFSSSILSLTCRRNLPSVGNVSEAGLRSPTDSMNYQKGFRISFYTD